jgi:hypothetical protein
MLYNPGFDLLHSWGEFKEITKDDFVNSLDIDESKYKGYFNTPRVS